MKKKELKETKTKKKAKNNSKRVKNKKKNNKLKKFFAKQEKYTNKDIILITITSIAFGFVTCLFCLMFITGGKNIITLCFDLKDFVKSYNVLTEKYYDKTDKQELINAAIKGMYYSVDDAYTTYMDKDETDDFEETISGKYEGIGCTVTTNNDNNIVVHSIFENTPADKTDLQVGDIIIKVDGEDYTSKTSSDLATYIKTNKNKTVVLTVKREDEEKEITINREKVEIPSVSSKIYEKNNKKIGYIEISTFSSVTKNQFEKKLKELEKDKIESLIIDVRNNGGGYLDCVTDITDLFLKKGEIVYQLETNGEKEKIKDTTKTYRDYNIAVLTNKGSASASEILASALKETYGGYVVGTNTYGKGTVQETMTMKDGSIIKYTTKKWLTPKGNWINQVGLEPTDKIEQNEEYYKDPKEENDSQLQKALEILSE